MLVRFLTISLLIVAGAVDAQIPHHARSSEVASSYHDTHEGMVRPLANIEAQVVPNMKRQGATYIGAEYNAKVLQYRLKFMNDGKVIWIDVDGHSGAVVGQAGR